MRRYVAYGIILLTVLFTSCTNGGVTAPDLPEALQKGSDTGSTEACHQNMISISEECVIYYAVHGTYPESLTELGAPFDSLTCPGCQLPYILQGDQSTFSILCPLPSDPTHGRIVDGYLSWTQAQGGADQCRSNMRVIASQCVLFFAQHDRYPETLNELGPSIAGLTCYDCGLPYVYYSYEYSPVGTSFFIGCPLCSDPNHGHIRDGIPSWPEP